MPTVNDVAKYILKKHGPMSAMKLQKLVYYSQSWSLVWDERPLFEDKIKAWANGPVAPALYAEHKGKFTVDVPHISGDPDALDTDGKATVLAVLKFYGDKTAQWLSDLTHSERPWKDARRGLAAGERGNSEITPKAMADYYGNIKRK